MHNFNISKLRATICSSLITKVSIIFVSIIFASISLAGPTWAAPRLLKDISDQNPGSKPGSFVQLGDRVVFGADTTEHGRELWISDGTADGTHLLFDLNPGPADSYFSQNAAYSRPMVVASNRLFFSGSDDDGREKLWVTRPWSPDFADHPGVEMVVDNFLKLVGTWRDRVLFHRYVGGEQSQLWWSDGTPEGTRRLGTFDGVNWPHDSPNPLIFGDRLILGGRTAITGIEPWAIDLNTGDATLLGDLIPGRSSSLPSRFDRAVLAGQIYFVAGGPDTGTELWTTDGTPEGTRLFMDLVPGSDSSRPSNLVRAGDLLYLEARGDDANGDVMWVSDGTARGTRRLRPRAADFQPQLSRGIELDGKLLFAAEADNLGIELWVSDGTDPGTYRLLDLHPGPLGSLLRFQTVWHRPGRPSLLVLDAHTPEYGRELWLSNGTSEGTRLLADLKPGNGFSQALATAIDDRLWLHADDGEHGPEPWISDGETTRLLADLNILDSTGAAPSDLRAIGDRLYFQVDSNGLAPLWSTDGTEAGTLPIVDSEQLSYIRSATVIGERLYFQASSPQVGTEIFRLQGAGPAVALDLVPGPRGADPSHLTPVGNRLFYTRRSAGVTELWSLSEDDTPILAGPILPHPSGDQSTPADPRAPAAPRAAPSHHANAKSSGFVPAFECLYPWGDHVAAFIVEEGGIYSPTRNDEEWLWIADGTAGGARPVARVTHLGDSRDTALAIDHQLFFPAWDEAHGQELWVSDGTADGTHLVADLTSGADGSWIVDLVAGGPHLYFSAYVDGIASLWRTDGTELGTEQIPAGPIETDLWSTGESIYFTSNTAQTGTELRRLAVDTGLIETVIDIVPGRVGSLPRGIASVGERFYFSAQAQASGRELYVTDGTLRGTRMLGDIAPGNEWSNPQHVAELGDSVIWSADDKTHGKELWIDDTEPTATTTCAGDELLCLSDERFQVSVLWRNSNGLIGPGFGHELTSDTGGFWFFDPDNLELMVKVLDGRAINGHFWVFVGSLSNVEFELRVRDTQTGDTVVYRNPQGTFAGFGDTEALPGDSPRPTRSVRDTSDFGPGSRPLPPLKSWLAPSSQTAPRLNAEVGADCSPDAHTLCLVEHRFRLTVDWRSSAGRLGFGLSRELTSDTGAFWFFHPDNLELIVKVLDGRAINGRFWVFVGALSNVEFNLRIEDTHTGESVIYQNPQGTFAAFGDTDALPGG